MTSTSFVPGQRILPRDDLEDGAVGELPTSSAVSWGAIIAGAVVMLAVMVILLMLGTGVGLSMVSPWYGAGASVTTVGVTTVVWWVVVQWISSGIGGFLAGRLRTKWHRLHTHEVFFRDTAHGFVAWSLASVAGAVMLATVTASVVGAGAGGAVATAATTAGSPGGTDIGLGYFLDTLYRPSTPSAVGGGGESRQETVRLLTRSAVGGQVALSPEDRTYLIQMVTARTGLDPAASAQRVDTVVSALNLTDLRLRAAADYARKRAAQLAIVAALSLLTGAFVASAAAALGGSLRDEY
jgi:hypothetical protein